MTGLFRDDIHKEQIDYFKTHLNTQLQQPQYNINKKHSYCWQTARRMCTLMCCQELPSGEWLQLIGQIFRLLPTLLPYDAVNRRHLRAIEFIFGTGKLEWPCYNLVKVAWWSTQSFGHNTSTWQTHRQPRRHSKCHPVHSSQVEKLHPA